MASHSGLGVGASVSAPIFFTKNQAKGEILQRLVKWWMLKYPAEAKLFAKDVQAVRGEMKRTNGMSDQGTCMTIGILPPRLKLMADRLVPDFWKEGGYEEWKKQFPALSVK